MSATKATAWTDTPTCTSAGELTSSSGHKSVSKGPGFIAGPRCYIDREPIFQEIVLLHPTERPLEKSTERLIDSSIHRRFDRRETVFYRRDIFTGFDSYHPDKLDPADPELLELAEARASWLLHDNYSAAFLDSIVGDRKLVKGFPPFMYEFPTPETASKNIMAVAKRFGASKVGITKLDDAWLYSHRRSGSPVALPDEARWAVVMLVEMKEELIARSPDLAAAAESGRGYSRMAALSGAIGEYMRLLGYYARSCGNDTALSIPLAMDAGLGVMGRSGLLLTREFGPRVRICKVITDLELLPTENEYPIMERVCGGCTLCAKACEADALSFAGEPTYEILTKSNNPGVLRWQFNPEKCFDYWLDIGRDCSNCIAACPAAKRLRKLKA
ncbi:MAG: 4Fe-4S dicluster domain-containing protein [Candidatus Aegiribacteria sp.]|nr:4Fe-4S dicluster domain-containing protein [Candidatus Aegiribacteria sp.]MBD3294937.1 4Fe-4S dicluster domain-containing protein [Candidatus Fermentibacteria bacterium]